MYKRNKTLEILLKKTEEFESAIYDNGNVRDIRFLFPFQQEKFFLVYPYDYSTPFIYRKTKNKMLKGVRDFTVPPNVKARVNEVSDSIKQLNQKYYPFIPNDQLRMGIFSFKSVNLNEIKDKEGNITNISVVYDILLREEKVNSVTLDFIKVYNGWKLKREQIENKKEEKKIIASLSIFEQKLLKVLNEIEHDTLE